MSAMPKAVLQGLVFPQTIKLLQSQSGIHNAVLTTTPSGMLLLGHITGILNSMKNIPLNCLAWCHS